MTVVQDRVMNATCIFIYNGFAIKSRKSQLFIQSAMFLSFDLLDLFNKLQFVG